MEHDHNFHRKVKEFANSSAAQHGKSYVIVDASVDIQFDCYTDSEHFYLTCSDQWIYRAAISEEEFEWKVVDIIYGLIPMVHKRKEE